MAQESVLILVGILCKKLPARIRNHECPSSRETNKPCPHQVIFGPMGAVMKDALLSAR